MEDYSPHSDLGHMNNSGISDTGGLRQGKNGFTAVDVINLKRQGYVKHHQSTLRDSASFLALIQAMNEQKLMNQVRAADAQNHRDGSVTSDRVSQTAVNAYYAMRDHLFAGRADNENSPNLAARPRLDLDEAA